MSNYRGPATLTVAGDSHPGAANLRTGTSGLHTTWGGTFTPADGLPFNSGNGTVSTSSWTAEVLVRDVRGMPGNIVADIDGEHDAPF